MAFPVSKLELKRREKFLSQWDLARETGIIQTRLSLIERGETKPKPEEVRAISRALGVTLEEAKNLFVV